MNGQPWEIIIVKDKNIIAKLAAFKNKWIPKVKKEYEADFMMKAPTILVFCVHVKESYSRWIENGVIAGVYAVLSATTLGLGSAFTTAYNLQKPHQVQELKILLGIPKSSYPVCIIPIGYTKEKPAPKRLRHIRGIIHHEKF